MGPYNLTLYTILLLCFSPLCTLGYPVILYSLYNITIDISNILYFVGSHQPPHLLYHVFIINAATLETPGLHFQSNLGPPFLFYMINELSPWHFGRGGINTVLQTFYDFIHHSQSETLFLGTHLTMTDIGVTWEMDSIFRKKKVDMFTPNNRQCF